MNKWILIGVALLCAGTAQTAAADIAVGVEFTAEEARIIASWYDERGHRVEDRGNGKGKPKGLPPGVAKNLARGKALPPGIAMQHLPDGLASILPPPPRGFDRVIVDGRVLLIEVATQMIHDVLVDLVLK